MKLPGDRYRGAILLVLISNQDSNYRESKFQTAVGVQRSIPYSCDWRLLRSAIRFVKRKEERNLGGTTCIPESLSPPNAVSHDRPNGTTVAYMVWWPCFRRKASFNFKKLCGYVKTVASVRSRTLRLNVTAEAEFPLWHPAVFKKVGIIPLRTAFPGLPSGEHSFRDDSMQLSTLVFICLKSEE